MQWSELLGLWTHARAGRTLAAAVLPALLAVQALSFPALARASSDELGAESTGASKIFVEDSARSSRVRYLLEPEDGGDSPQERALASDAAQATSPAGETAIAGAQRVLVILVNFRDDRSRPWSPAEAEDVVLQQASDYFREASQQRTWLEGEVSGWHELSIDGNPCDSLKIAEIATAARSAAAASGADLGAYDRFLYAFPKISCAWWGLASLGGDPSEAWINGDLQLWVVAHELAHNHNLLHSDGLDCGAVPLGSLCTRVGLGDVLDVLGAPETGHLNAVQKERLSWLSGGAINTVEADGIYRLEPYELIAVSEPQALKVLKHVHPLTGERTWYYVEYRQPIGFDGFVAGNANVGQGVVVHLGSEWTADATFLLDMHPGAAWAAAPALEVGETFADPAGGMSLTVLAADASGATVSLASVPQGVPGEQITLSGGSADYARRDRVHLVAMLFQGGLPAARARVTFILTRPDGSTVVEMRRSRLTGEARFKYRVKRRDPGGAYTVAADAVFANGATAHAGTSFAVVP